MKRIILFIFCCTVLLVKAQTPITYSFRTETGLSDNEVYDLEQDGRGFIWVAANNGLLRYNGTEFEKKEIPNQKGIAVFCLTKDSDNNLWFTNVYGQFFKINKQNIELKYDVSKILNGNLPEFRVLDNNQLLLFSNKGLLKVSDTETTVLIDTPILKGFETKQHYLVIDQQQHLLYINKNTLQKEKEISLPYADINNPKFLTYHNTTYIFFKNHQESVLIKLENKEISPIKTPKDFSFSRLINIFKVNDNIWISDNNHVQVCKLTNSELTVEKTIFESEKISDVLIDIHQNTWLATLQNGISVSPNNSISQLPYNPIETGYIVGSEKISDTQIVYYTDKANLVFTNLKTGVSKVVTIPTKSTISTMTVDPNNKCLYIGINDNESFKYNLKTQQFTKINTLNVSKAIEIIDNDILYLTFDKSILYKNFGKPTQTKHLIENVRAYTAHYSRRNNCIILSSASGIKKFNKEATTYQELTYNGEKLFSTSMAETDDGTLFIASKTKGLFYLSNNQLTPYPLELNNTNIQFIKSYKNKLWIVTDKSIDVITPKTKEHCKYGLRFGVVYPVKALEITENQLFYTTNKEVFKTNKKDFLGVKDNKPTMFFTSVSFMDKDTTLQKNYTLPYSTNNLKFSFSTNHFNSTDFIQYKYRLKGLEDNWQTTAPGQNSIKYQAVPSGTYSFQIKPFFIDTLKEGATENIGIAINKPIWLQWWFSIACLLLIGFIAFGILKYRNNQRIRKKNEEISNLITEKRMAALQLENLRSQMNPHFLFNALNSIQEYIVNNEKKLASAYLVKFSRLMRLYLEHSKVNEISLEEELKTIDLYLTLEQNRFDGSFTYHIKVDAAIQPTHLLVPSLLLQPYIENAIKHGLSHKKGKKELTLTVITKDNYLEVCIDDNGIGRKAAQAINRRSRPNHKSFATQASDKRIEILNAQQQQQTRVTYTDKEEDGTPTGTKVCITIPTKTLRR
ncbi:sensor histidine kinase [Neptunitalea lumnitzerae]|uniref:Histidine kinase n=1 Tax=Neptunitalea lumnitzerae TaxID=2965509 RepID=A0ABQ5MEK8_9FLAO|nr:histidine kinase [Neptunitalea sp. Y10]GLB47781.1 histidine kinase [Neptunitalea sp. Y10]